LVFGSDVSEMSSRRQAATTMLYAAWGSRGRQETLCKHRRCRREGARLADVQSPAFDARALPRRPPSPPIERASSSPSPEGRLHDCGDSGLVV
jgi:hypothetical protein